MAGGPVGAGGWTARLAVDAAAALATMEPEGPGQRALRAEYLEFVAAHPDAVSRDCSAGHLTASTLVVDPGGGRVLLTLHAKLRRWLQFGGHLEPGDASLHAAAAREAAEESGVAGLVVAAEPVRLDRHEIPACRSTAGAERRLDHLDVQYLALAPEGAEPTASDESIAVRWWPWDSLPGDDASVAALVAAARSRWG